MTSNAFEEKNNDEFKLSEILSFWLRRRKLIITISSILFIFSIVSISYRRIFSPIYKGYFLLLINDPIDDSKFKRRPTSQIEELANNVTQNDLPTLINLLKSPYILRPVADEYNIDPLKLAKRLTINIGIGESNLDVGRYKYMAANSISFLVINWP